MFFLGMDLSLDWFDFYVLNQSGTKLFSGRLNCSHDGYTSLFEKIRNKHIPFEKIHVALENPHHPLVLACMMKNMNVYAVNPKTTDRLRDRHRPGRTKSDAFDAYVLADFLRTDLHRLSPLLPSSEDDRRLLSLHRDLEALKRSRGKIIHQLSQALDESFPTVKKLFSDPYCPSAIAFIKNWPSLESAKKHFPRRATHFFKKYSFSHSRRKTFLSTLKEATPVTYDQAIEQTRESFLKALAEQISLINDQIASFEKQIQNVIEHHPDRDIFKSLPGVGKTILTGLLVVFCSKENHFQNARSLKAQAGLSPVVFSSGKFLRANRFRHACQKNWRNIFTLWAFVCISPKRCLWARLHYDQLRNEGKSHYHALRILASKLAKITFACWRDRTFYDEKQFLASKMEHLLLTT